MDVSNCEEYVIKFQQVQFARTEDFQLIGCVEQKTRLVARWKISPLELTSGDYRSAARMERAPLF